MALLCLDSEAKQDYTFLVAQQDQFHYKEGRATFQLRYAYPSHNCGHGHTSALLFEVIARVSVLLSNK